MLPHYIQSIFISVYSASADEQRKQTDPTKFHRMSRDTLLYSIELVLLTLVFGQRNNRTRQKWSEFSCLFHEQLGSSLSCWSQNSLISATSGDVAPRQ